MNQSGFHESDWKVLRSLHEVALQRYCERVLNEMSAVIADSSKSSHERYLEVYKRIIDHDREIARVFNDSKRSRALLEIAGLCRNKLLEEDEFMRFTESTRETVEVLLKAKVF